MEQIIDEIIIEASNGKIIIDGDLYTIAFNTIIYKNGQESLKFINNESYQTLIVKDKSILITKLMEYVSVALININKFPTFSKEKDKNKIKMLIAYLFVNATTEDFLYPIKMINRNISFINDDTFSYLDAGVFVELQTSFNDSLLSIKNSDQSVFMETSKKIQISLFKKIDEEEIIYDLPSVTYGIFLEDNMEKVCYIYTLLNSKQKKEKSENENKYYKKVIRELYKLNAFVHDGETLEYKECVKQENDYYIENISDISPSALLSLTIFMSLLKKENIKKIKVVPYLPIRFSAREITALNEDDKEKAALMDERNVELQRNITDKFIRTFRRVCFHLKCLEIKSLPYEFSEYMEMKINEKETEIENVILKDVYSSISEQLKNNVKK